MITPAIRAFLRFNRGMLGLPPQLQVWMAMLVAANLVAPLFFLDHVEAKITITAGLLGMVIMSALTARFGFSRIVGLGHIAWLPLIAFLGTRLADAPATDAFGIWLHVVVALDAASLVFDALDVIRFTRGERAEIVPTRAAPQE
jgi:hypothetical protein